MTRHQGDRRLSTLASVQLLGSTAESYIKLPERTQDGTGLHISMPSSDAPFSAPAYVVKLTFSGPIPALGRGGTNTATWVKIANVATGLVLDSGGNVASGSVPKQW